METVIPLPQNTLINLSVQDIGNNTWRYKFDHNGTDLNVNNYDKIGLNVGVDANGQDIEGVYQFNVPVDYPITFNYYSEDDATGNMIEVDSYDTKVTDNSIDYYSGIVIIK